MDAQFKYGRKKYDYCAGDYNHARYNERAVEVPVALAYLKGHEADALEVGAVLPHYLPWDEPDYPRHTVVDLYEKGPGITNADLFMWQPDRKYKRVIAVSTLEHPGGKTPFVIALNILKSWVAPGGLLFVTAPAGWRTTHWMTAPALAALEMSSVRRFDKVRPTAHGWEEAAPLNGKLPRAYGSPTPWANTVYLMEWRP